MKNLPARLLFALALVCAPAAVAVSKVTNAKPAIHAPVADDGIPRPCTLCRTTG